MQIKPIKLSQKKGGNGYVSSYSVNLGCTEVRTVGFLDDNGKPLPLEKVIDSENACYTGNVQKVNKAAGWESAACTANVLVPFFSNIKQHILYLFPWQPGKTGNTLL